MWRDLGQKKTSTQFFCLLAQMLTSMHTIQMLALTSLLEALYFLSLSNHRTNTDALSMKAVPLKLTQSAT